MIAIIFNSTSCVFGPRFTRRIVAPPASLASSRLIYSAVLLRQTSNSASCLRTRRSVHHLCSSLVLALNWLEPSFHIDSRPAESVETEWDSHYQWKWGSCRQFPMRPNRFAFAIFGWRPPWMFPSRDADPADPADPASWAGLDCCFNLNSFVRMSLVNKIDD